MTLRVLQGTVVWEGHLPPKSLPIQYLLAKDKYLKTKLIVIGKRFPCNAFCYTRRTTFFIKTSKFLCFFGGRLFLFTPFLMKFNFHEICLEIMDNRNNSVQQSKKSHLPARMDFRQEN